MKILVLGNGFDLDHNLPTGYMDFLNFCNYALDMDNPESLYKKELSECQLEYAKILAENKEIRETFLIFIKNNRFLTYFNNRISKQSDNWIDFEREIKNVINEFRSIELGLIESNQYHYSTGSDHKIYKVIKDLGLPHITNDSWDEITLAAIHQDLCHSLNYFSQALEYYISTFINTTTVNGVSPDIIDFDATKVITFNYSDTYERHYAGTRWNESIEHVHGNAISNLEKGPNIILGITSDDMELQSSYVEFEKYFQRITKKTGNEYKKWLQGRLNEKEKIEVAFFGHSLDASDSDIIKDLISNENSRVKIFYHSDIAHQQIVANLINIIGKNALISYVSGETPKICFQKQRVHENTNTAGIEITRDIRALYNMHNMNTFCIETLLSKIRQKIKNKDIAYFYSQRKVISLFEALKSYDISEIVIDDFVDICRLLPYESHENGNIRFYEDEEWFDGTPWGETIFCKGSTSKLIHAINKSNEIRFQINEEKKIYTRFLKLKNCSEIKTALLEIFSEDNPSKEYWEELRKLIDFMLDNSDLKEAIMSLQNEHFPLEIEVKVKHFIDLYHEEDFYSQYAKEAAKQYQYDEEI